MLTLPAGPFKLDLAVALQAARVAPLSRSGAGGWVVFVVIVVVVVIYVIYIIYVVVVVAIIDRVR